MDPFWLALEGATLAAPAWALSRAHFQNRWKKALAAPLFYEGEVGWSLARLVAEFNGEVDVEAALAEAMGWKTPLALGQLQSAVQRLQADAHLRRSFLRELAADAALAGPGPLAARAPLDLMESLDGAFEAEGFRGLWAATSARRLQALLPVATLQSGGVGGAPSGAEALGPSLGGTLLEAGRKALLGEGPGGWATVGAELLGALAEARAVAQEREARRRNLARLGRAAMQALAQGGPSGQALRRNAHQSGDAYRQLALAWKARAEVVAGWGWPHLAMALQPLVAQAFQQAEAIAAERGRAIEAVLRGKQGPEAAGALLLAHREALTRGLAEDALPFPRAGEEAL